MSDTRTEIITNDVFISWTGKDKAIKDAVKAHLEDKGLTCTDSQIDCAGNYFEWSKQAATVSHIAVLILTENSIKSSTYQKTELQEIVKVFGENFSNRLVTFCPNQAVYNLETFGENGESLLADNYNSAVFFGEEVTREALEDLATKVTNLLLGRTFEIYKAACEASEKKMGLLSFFVDRQQGNTSVDYDKIYIERNVKDGGGNELSAKELLASGDLLLVYGPSGMGKTEYIKQLRRAAAPEVLTVVVRCSDLWRSGKTVHDYLYANVASGVQNAAFTDKHFERLWSGRDRLVVFDGLDEVPTTATTDLFFQKIGEFCRAKADGRRTQLIFTSRNKDDANRFANDSIDVKSRLRFLELQPLNDDQIRKLCASLGQVFGFDGSAFSFAIKRLDEKIKTNPLLVSQLAIIYKNEGSIPYDDMEMAEKLAEIVFGVEDRAKVLDVKGAEITNLRALVEAFAALQYEYPEENDFDVMREALESCNERADSAHVLEYFKKRAIYVDGRYLHKSLGEFFAAYGFARRACGLGGKVKDKELLDFVIRHCGDDSWGSIVNWFVRKTKLKTLVIPDEVKRIGKREFYKCGTLTSITIPNSVTSIDEWAFSGCSGLKSITIPDSVTSIDEWAFSGCSGLKSITIPDSVTSIGETTFMGCDQVVNRDGVVAYVDKWVIRDADQYSYGHSSNAGFVPHVEFSIENIILRDDTVGIGTGAFFGYVSLTSISIPDSVKSICGGAFQDCSGLTNVTIPDSVTSIGEETFYNCSGMNSITIPKSVTSIGDRAFWGCESLASVVIPDSVTSIGHFAFMNCASLTDVYYQGDFRGWLKIEFGIGSSNPMRCAKNLYINGQLLQGDIVIPEGTEKIGDSVFDGCSGLTSVTIGNGVTSIGEYAFLRCSGLKSVTIPDGVTSIGEGAFSDCDGLTSVTIGNGVTSIGDWAFKGCSGLTSVTISDSVTSIGRDAFSWCSGLISVTIPDSVTSIGKWAFDGCCSLTDITYHGTMIQWRAIKKSGDWDIDTPNYKVNCKDGVLCYEKNGILTSVAIGDDVTSIGDWAFLTCSGLTSITIPDSVTSVGKGAFSGCSGLTSVTIPDSVTRVGDYAFYNCSSLTSVTYSGTMSQWRTIKKGDDWDEDVPVYKVHCADGVLIKNGNHFDEVPQVQVFGEERGDAENRSNASLASDALRRDNAMTVIDDYAYAGRSDFTSIAIPDNVSSIGKKAFFACGLLMDGTIGEGVVSIGKKAFAWCINLRKITIGGNVSSIGKRAFKRCRSLTTITYHGTMAQWRAIEKASDWDKGTPDYKIYCTDGVLDKDDERNI